MKTKKLHPAIKAVLFVLAAFMCAVILGILTSCDTDPLTVRDEYLFYPIDEDTFSLADLKYPELGHVEYENGFMFNYTSEKNSWRVVAPRTITELKFYENMLDLEPEEMNFEGQNFTMPITEYGFVSIVY